jgi:alpha-glucosidase
LPYLYTLAWEAHTKGLPIIRPLFWVALENPDLWEIDDAFLLGDSLLIAPILEPQTISRKLQLPPGEWISFWDQTRYQGPALVTLPAHLENIPILLRAGSILPMQKDNRLVLFITLPSKNANQFDEKQKIGQLYSDAGDGYGDWRLDTFYISQIGESKTISWESQGSYPFPFDEIEILFNNLHPQSILLDSKKLPISTSYIIKMKFSQLQIMHQ